MRHGTVGSDRIRRLTTADADREADYVLYWMTASRRLSRNHSLQRAVDWSMRLGRGLVILEALRCDYPWASHRLHRFVIDGMAGHQKALERAPGVRYYPYIEDRPGAGRGLLAELSRRAAVVVTDDYPTFFVPAMLDAAAPQIRVAFEAVDSNGLVPMRATEKAYPSAYTFRRYLQKVLPEHLAEGPEPDPLARLAALARPVVPEEVALGWPEADLLASDGPDLDRLPLDASVGPVAARGGVVAAHAVLHRLVTKRLARYAEDGNKPEHEATSGLSPYLHFGHISAHEVITGIVGRENWNEGLEGRKADGKRTGWWGLDEPAEAFLDQIVTWRELGFNMAVIRPDHADYDSLPEWARTTLAEHAADPREHGYTLEQFDAADTHDELWNAAQRQLRREGRIHNYLRMLWGKKILEWSESPQEAARIMIELNNCYALDGRDPNSYSGIYWCLGRYDRPWGPERPVFGKIRYMSSKNTARKVSVRGYLDRYSR